MLFLGAFLVIAWIPLTIALYTVIIRDNNAIYHYSASVVSVAMICCFTIFIAGSFYFDETGPHIVSSVLTMGIGLSLSAVISSCVAGRRTLVGEDGLHERSMLWKTRHISWRFVKRAFAEGEKGHLSLEIYNDAPLRVPLLADKLGLIWEALKAQNIDRPTRDELEKAIEMALRKSGDRRTRDMLPFKPPASDDD